MDRLFGVLELRAVNDELREFEGIANTGATDTHDTIVEPSGARFQLPLPLLWFHDAQIPVGEIVSAELLGGRWLVRGVIRTVTEPGAVKDATDKAWHSIKYKLVRGLSIGFNGLKRQGNRFLEWSWRELSLVTLPSNVETTILSVRSAYQLAASGDPRVSYRPGVSVTPHTPRQTMTLKEQITQHENSRAAKVGQRDAILEKSAAEGRTLDESESQQFDALDSEIRSIDGHLTRLASALKDSEKRAVPVTAANGRQSSESRNGSPVVRVRDNAEPGIAFARYAMALMACHGNRFEAMDYVRQRFPAGDITDQVVIGLQTRAAVAPGTTTNATFMAPFVTTTYAQEFLEMLRPSTLIGKIPGMRHVPFNVSMPAQTAGGSYKWVGQGKQKPVTNAQYASVTLGSAKAAGIIVLTEELVRQSSPSAEAAVREEMRAGIQAFLDAQFVDPAVAAVAGQNPASITNGVGGTAASGTTPAAARTDIAAKIAAFAALGYPLSGLVILMSESQAFNLGIAVITGTNENAFPNLGITGGSILGVPVITSQAVGNQIVVAHAPSILIADDGQIEIDASREASLQLDSAPMEPPDATVVFTSLWQANLVGLRVERFITWGKARSTAVGLITGVAYVP